jgi:hypothetical protein
MAGNDPSGTDQAAVYVYVDPKVAAAVAAWVTELTARAVWTASGTQTPRWIAMVVALLDDLATQLAQADGQAVGTARQADTARTPGVLAAPARIGVLASAVVPAAPLSTHPLLTWLRLRFGIRRCLACGQGGNRSLQPAHPLVSPAWARTWQCIDRIGCRQRRISRQGRR